MSHLNTLATSGIEDSVVLRHFNFSTDPLPDISNCACGPFTALKNNAEMRKAAFYTMGEVEMVMPAVKLPTQPNPNLSCCCAVATPV